jgi:hypothetical protein
MTAGPPEWRCATTPATSSTSFMITQPCTVSEKVDVQRRHDPRQARLGGRGRLARSLTLRGREGAQEVPGTGGAAES